MGIEIIDDDQNKKEEKKEKPINLNLNSGTINVKPKNFKEIKEEANNLFSDKSFLDFNQDVFVYKSKYDLNSYNEILIRFYELTKIRMFLKNHTQKYFIQNLFFFSHEYDDKLFEQQIVDLINKLLQVGYLKKYYYKDKNSIIKVIIGINPTKCGFTPREFREFYEVNEDLLDQQEELKKEYFGNDIVCDACNSKKIREIGSFNNPVKRINGVEKKLFGIKLIMYHCNNCGNDFFVYKQLTLLEDGVFIEDDINKNK